ncbi:lytic transglycosylase domain-containing protein [Vulgatibacter incomptus]|uniref:Membrane-bound lytic murein transglycosylase D n=1 Tax=Vulgatibacter incomptus TaxID=1391653 RepID=A0A0K1PBV5_9BACT|nr:lytic transglycosylase domain-containing protein [Vulgatibacter incomptus]AKU90886.1 Membrane-bound lytic murein transglycosylase D precursor [Vulgatibacter incomptus]
MIRRLLLLLTGSILAAPSMAPASSIRQWTDKDGVVHFSNVKRGGERSPARLKPTKEGGVRVVLEGKPEAEAAKPYRPREVKDYDEHLREACERYRIPFAFARAIAAAESNFNPAAVSHAGAMGLMQLMPSTAVSMYVDDAFDPRENIHGGVRYLRLLTNLFEGDLVKVIAAYNAGPEAVRKAGGIPRFEETQTYVKRVLELYRRYKAEQDGT